MLGESPTVPGEPNNITVNTTCNSLTVSWLPPGEDGGSNVTDYNVTVVNGTEDGPLLESVPTGGNTTVRITSLKPNTLYTIQVRARNSVGTGDADSVNVTTMGRFRGEKSLILLIFFIPYCILPASLTKKLSL